MAIFSQSCRAWVVIYLIEEKNKKKSFHRSTGIVAGMSSWIFFVVTGRSMLSAGRSMISDSGKKRIFLYLFVTGGLYMYKMNGNQGLEKNICTL